MFETGLSASDWAVCVLVRCRDQAVGDCFGSVCSEITTFLGVQFRESNDNSPNRRVATHLRYRCGRRTAVVRQGNSVRAAAAVALGAPVVGVG
jgi:hypothetical protein